MDAEQRFWIRILLYDDVSQCTVDNGSSLKVSSGQGAQFEWNRKDPLRITASPSGLKISNRTIDAKKLLIEPKEPHIFTLNGSRYRGKLQIIMNAHGTGFDAVNHVPVEPYLAGVVGAEMPDYWEPAALQAQAIAARTYCLHIKRQFGVRRHWDVRGTESHQVYLGLAGESSQVWEAVNATSGRILVLASGSGRKYFPTYYSSVCGGHTEASSSVFGDSYSSLNGVQCEYCRDVAKPGFFFWPTVRIDKESASAKLLNKYPSLEPLGEVSDIVVERRSDYEGFSRMTRIRLIGSTGATDNIRGEDLRLTLDPTGRKLRSTICRIEDRADQWAFVSGRGYGHGVGMCQCGAQGLARDGAGAIEILSHYYPGSRTESIY
jgi:stage II sporulation protein D